MEDIYSVIKARNIPKIIEIFENKEFDLYMCDEHGVGLTHLCCRYGLLEVVRLLIEKGINFNSCTNNGDTPLHIVAQFNHNELFEEIIKLPVLIDEKNSIGNTPLHYACFWSNVKIALKLVQLGCDISRRNQHNQSPLDLASIDLAEKLANEYNQKTKRQGKIDPVSRLKTCCKAITLNHFRLEPTVTFDDIEIESSLWKSVSEEKKLGKLKDKLCIVRKLNPERNKVIVTSIFFQEYSTLSVWNQKCILSPAGFLYSSNELWIIQPHFNLGGSLYDFIRFNKQKISDEMKLDFAIDICQGMQYIHKNPDLMNKFVLSAKNITVDNNLEAKINLGQCIFSFQSRKKILDAAYYSPEALVTLFGNYDKISADVWSYGIIINDIYSDKPIPEKVNEMHAGYKISILKEPPKVEIEDSQIAKIVNLCLNQIPSKRPQFQLIQPILTKMKEIATNK